MKMTKILKLIVIFCVPFIIFGQYADEGDIYFKSSAGYGIGEEDIKTGWLDDSGDRIYIKPGGGFTLDIGGGVHINPRLCLEVDFGYQISWKNLSNLQVSFKKTPLTVRFKHHLLIFNEFHFYGTLGAQAIFAANYSDKNVVTIFNNETIKIKYKTALAGQLGVGFQYQKEDADVYFFGEARLINGSGLKPRAVEINNVEDKDYMTPDVNINGMYFVVGLGYYY
jgi:hypothetical protein